MMSFATALNWVIQSEYANSPESRAILLVAMLGSDHVIRARLDDLDSDLDARDANPNDVPVGSVEFVQTYADWVGVVLPDPVDYPEDLRPYLRRTIRRMPLSDAPQCAFVKPVGTKRFQAVRSYDPASPPAGVPLSTKCWVSDPVEFGSEYRFYVQGRAALGWAQYDDGPEHPLSKRELALVGAMIASWREQPRAWALDVGHLPGGHLAVVEVNDAWATGLYPEAITSREYAGWLRARWSEMLRPSG